MEKWTINNEQAKKILSTKITKIPESKVFNDLTLPKEERIKHASKILESWKNSQK